MHGATNVIMHASEKIYINSNIDYIISVYSLYLKEEKILEKPLDWFK